MPETEVTAGVRNRGCPKSRRARLPPHGPADTAAPLSTHRSGMHLKLFCSRATKGRGPQIGLLCRRFTLRRLFSDPVHLVWPALPLRQQFRSGPRGRHRHVLRLGGEARHLGERPAAPSAVARASSWFGPVWEQRPGTRAWNTDPVLGPQPRTPSRSFRRGPVSPRIPRARSGRSGYCGCAAAESSAGGAGWGEVKLAGGGKAGVGWSCGGRGGRECPLLRSHFR